MGLALNTNALGDNNPGASHSTPRPATTQDSSAATITDEVGHYLQEVQDMQKYLLELNFAPGERTLAQLLDERRQFLAKADAYRRSFQVAQDNYRRYLMLKKNLEDSCSAGAGDIAGMPVQFADMIRASNEQCRGRVAEMESQARLYARQLHGATGFLAQLDKAAAHVQNGVDRIEHLQELRELSERVDAGLRAMEMGRLAEERGTDASL